MINFIEVCNYSAGTKIDKLSCNAFLLNTCQRTLMVGVSSHPEFQALKAQYKDQQIDNYTSTQAYRFLLEIICGLQSKLAGESEIICQFKEAYLKFNAQDRPNSVIMKFMEKLFQDAKNVRKNYLNIVHQVSYASITRSIIKKSSNSKRILILGTGKLAEDLAKTLFKKYDVYVTGRNTEAMAYFSENYHCHILSWEAKELIKEFPVIINTIGAKLDFLNEDFFPEWQTLQSKYLFVDLSSTSILPFSVLENKNIFILDDIFNFAKKENESKENTINKALEHIGHIVEKRKHTFNHHNNYGWDDLVIC